MKKPDNTENTEKSLSVNNIHECSSSLMSPVSFADESGSKEEEYSWIVVIPYIGTNSLSTRPYRGATESLSTRSTGKVIFSGFAFRF